MSDLAARVARLEARADIAELVSRYFVAVDDRDYDALSTMFTEDAVFGDFVGRPAVMGRLRDRQTHYGATIHSGHGLVLDFAADDRATGILLAHCEIAQQGTTVFGAMRYYDTYVRRADRWLFASRRTAFYHVGPWADVSSSLTAELRKRQPDLVASRADLPQFA